MKRLGSAGSTGLPNQGPNDGSLNKPCDHQVLTTMENAERLVSYTYGLQKDVPGRMRKSLIPKSGRGHPVSGHREKAMDDLAEAYPHGL